VASGYARDIFEGAGEVVDDFAFAFIAPLRAYHHDRVHFWPFLPVDPLHLMHLSQPPGTIWRMTLPSPSWREAWWELESERQNKSYLCLRNGASKADINSHSV
jgi:hypothetical protein